MAIRGQRFHVDLDTDNDTQEFPGTIPANLGSLVGDVKERVISSDAKPPSLPKIKGSETGFPAHSVKFRSSKFKQNKDQNSSDTNRPSQPELQSTASLQQSRSNSAEYQPLSTRANATDIVNASDDSSIDEENKSRLAHMSSDEIEAARQELMSGLSPSLIGRLLKKANIDEGRADQPTQSKAGKPDKDQLKKVLTKKVLTKKVTFSNQEPPPRSGSDAPPQHPPPDLQPASSQTILPLSLIPEFHFPKVPVPPALDPSDPDFQSNLHTTYFPNLPADPSTLAWMAPIDKKEQEFYSPSQPSLPPSSIRFDFRGHLLPPRLSSQISTAKGLHHHAHAPESAGYTVPELAHLARSVFPAQRCIAYQTLGRLLYRLGRGDFGQEGDELCDSLWGLMGDSRVVEGLVEAAGKDDEGNRSVWVTATEAVWLWRKGGGRKWKGR